MTTLQSKFIIYLIVLVVFVSLLFLAFFIYRSNYLIKENLRELGFSLVKNLSYSSELAIASEDEIFLKPYLEKIFAEKDVVLVTVYNKKGRIIISNKKIEIEEGLAKNVQQELLTSKDVLWQKNYSQKGDQVYDFYSPIFISEILAFQAESKVRDKDLAGFARVSLSLEKIAKQNKTILAGGLGIAVFLILLGVSLAIVLAGTMTKSIKELIRGVEIIGKGDLGYRIKLKTSDEIETLAESFNKMAERLGKSRVAVEEERAALEIKVAARTRELKEISQNLEGMVKERTKELEQKVEELERFYRLTVGRELKMIELKEELRKTQEESERLKHKS